MIPTVCISDKVGTYKWDWVKIQQEEKTLTKIVKTMAIQYPPMICNMANISHVKSKHWFLTYTPIPKQISIATMKKYPPPIMNVSFMEKQVREIH